MSNGPRRTYTEAMYAAERIVDALREGCERIEIAGSVRRGAPHVKDIEIVAVPKFRADLFGGTGDDMLNETIRLRVREKLFDWRDPRAKPDGEDRKAPPINENKLDDRRYYPLWASGTRNRLDGDDRSTAWPVDLFVVRPPAQWGAIMTIRTGPADYSQRLVTAAQKRNLRCSEGRLVSTLLATIGQERQTPEERDFIEACGMPYLPPDQRR